MLSKSGMFPSESAQNFGGNFFLFQREWWSRSDSFSVLNNRISTNVPGLRQHIRVNRTTLHIMSMAVQLQTIIVRVFQLLSLFHNNLILISWTDSINAMTRLSNSWFSESCAKRSHSIHGHQDGSVHGVDCQSTPVDDDNRPSQEHYHFHNCGIVYLDSFTTRTSITMENLTKFLRLLIVRPFSLSLAFLSSCDVVLSKVSGDEKSDKTYIHNPMPSLLIVCGYLPFPTKHAEHL